MQLRPLLPLVGITIALIHGVSTAAGLVGLADFYFRYEIPGTPVQADSLARPARAGLPSVRVAAGGIDPPPVVTSSGQYFAVDRFIRFAALSTSSQGQGTVLLWEPLPGPCRYVAEFLPNPVFVGATQDSRVEWYDQRVSNCIDGFATPPPGKWITNDRLTFGAPVRRQAQDGSSFDASPMTIVRSAVPWITYYWGFRLGLVESESNWSDSNLSKIPSLATWPAFPNSRDNFSLVALPPPIVDGEVVEYRNTVDFPSTPGGRFFYASSPEEREALDTVTRWQRTGRAFKSGGYVTVCRFYGSAVPGPNTHFFSADDKECDALRRMQMTPTPVDRQQLNYEGQKFAANALIRPNAVNMVPSCPIASVPLYRAYNNAAANSYRYDSGHRFSTRRDDIEAMVRRGWVDEGAVMCVPE